MASFDYIKTQATADRLIKRFGQVGSVKRAGAIDPINGGDPTETVYSANLVPVTYDQRLVDGSNVLSNDRKILISSVGLAIVPQPDDVVSAGGVDFLIIKTDNNNYDGVTNCVFICQGRIM